MQTNSKECSIVYPCHKYSMATWLALALYHPSAVLSQEIKERMLEEVFVIAQKREQNMQDIPVAVSVISEADIMNRSIAVFDDLLVQIPNVSIHQWAASSPLITVRGVASSTGAVGESASVGVAVDGVFLGRDTMFSTGLIDIERVEVLRGPQGTLFGKNTIGGLINIVTRKPAMEFEGSADLTVGEDNLVQTRAYVSGPLLPGRLAGKLSFMTKRQDGWVKNRTAGAKNPEDAGFWGVRGQLLGFFGDDASWLLSGEYSEDDTAGYARDILSGALTAYDDSPYDRTIGTNVDQLFKRENYGLSLQVDWHWGDYDLTSITATRGVDWLLQSDGDSTPASVIELLKDEEQSQFSQEFHILSQGEKHSWLAGVYYFQQQQDARDHFIFDSGVPEFFIGFDIPGYQENATALAAMDSQGIAAFLSTTWAFSPRWELTAGARITSEEKDLEFEQVNQKAVGFSIIGTVFPPSPYFEDDRSDTEWSGDIALTYLISEDISIYVKVARGFRAGGFNIGTTSSPDPRGLGLGFDSETLLSYELGFKSLLLNERMRFNAAVYHSEYPDKLERLLVGPGATITTSVGEATLEGVELELIAAATADLTVGATLGYQTAIFDDFINPFTGDDYRGNTIPLVPKYTASAYGQYNYDMSGGWSWVARLDVNYRDEISLHNNNEPEYLSGSHTLVNGRLGLSSPAGKYSAALWAKNILNEDTTLLQVYIQTFDTSFIRLNQPRMWGLELRVNF